MSNYTAEDFAQANLATKGRFDVARRTDPSLAHQWHVYGSRQGYFSDEEMAADGWVPVVEARIMEHAVRDLRDDLEVARKERAAFAHDLRRLYGQPKGDNAITLDALEAAWEAAEVPTASTGIRAGDVCIELCADHHFEVFRASVSAGGMVAPDRWEPAVRILSRAPKREPWEDLADVLADMGHLSPTGHAKALHARGVRVTGGEES